MAASHKVTVNGKLVYFDFSRRFGPLLTDADGEPLKRQPISERHPFWEPFKAWLTAWTVAHPEPAPPPPPPSEVWDNRRVVAFPTPPASPTNGGGES